jgi:hypothetical protein
VHLSSNAHRFPRVGFMRDGGFVAKHQRSAAYNHKKQELFLPVAVLFAQRFGSFSQPTLRDASRFTVT